MAYSRSQRSCGLNKWGSFGKGNDSGVYDLTSKLEPSMLSGWERPITARIVGATSPSTPSVFFKLQDSGALAMTKGTLLRV